MYRAPRGTADILPDEQRYWRYVEAKAEALGRRFGYGRLDTPVFEQSDLFTRGVGEGTDIVEKEMYIFQDRGGDSMALRPEGTAPVCRAYLEHGMRNLPQPVRLYYFCPVFRYERPQAGRFRQHHQFGVEALGDADPSIDAEVVEMAWRLTQDLGLTNLSLLVNSIGDPQCRPVYLEELKGYYAGRIDGMCQDCKSRLERNPLRLLDCKQEACMAVAGEAPRMVDHLCPECRGHWAELLKYLQGIGLDYRVEHRLVRGLDYYTRTVFEIQPPEEGGQSTICGGGRYDGLIEAMGGPPTPGVGFGSGRERLALNIKRQGVIVPDDDPLHAVIVYLGDEAKEAAIALASRLRSEGLSALPAAAGRSLRAQLRYANSLGAPYAIILGEEELNQGVVTIRDMAKGEQRTAPMGDVAAELAGGVGV